MGDAQTGAKVYSASEIAELLGAHRDTVRRWVADGCPYVRKAERKRGISWGFDLAQVHAWTVERAVAAATVEAGRETIAQLERQAAEVRLELLELQLATQRREVIRVEDAAEIVGREYDTLRRRLRSLPRSAAPQAALALQRASNTAAGEAAVEDVLEDQVEQCLATLSGIHDGAGGNGGAPPAPDAPNGDGAPARKARKAKARKAKADPAPKPKRVGRRKSDSQRGRGKRGAGKVANRSS